LFKTSFLKKVDSVFFDNTIRMTLDYQEDFNFFKAIFEYFKCVNNDVPLRTIVPFLRKNPEIVQLNAFKRQDWMSNQKKKTQLILNKSL